MPDKSTPQDQGCVGLAEPPATYPEPSSDPGAKRAVGLVSAGAAGRPGRRWVTLVAVVVAVIFLLRAGRPLVFSGDAVSDANALIAGKNFREHGFVRLSFLPVIEPGPLSDPARYYLHYPPAPDLLNGLMRVIGANELRIFRMLPAACSLLAIVVWYLAFRHYASAPTAALAAAVAGLSYPTFWLGDSVHHYGYGELVRALVLYLGIRVANPSGGRRWPFLAALAGALFVQPLISFDYVLWSLFVLVLVGATAFRPGLRVRTAVLLLMPAAGFALHLAQNAWAIGAWAALRDMWGALLFRSYAIIDLQRLFQLDRWANAVFARVDRFYGLGPATVLALGLLGVAASRRREEDRAAARLIAILVGAAFTWFIFFPQHTIAHTYTVRHYHPAIALALALGLRSLPAALEGFSERARSIAIALVVAAVVAEGAIPFLAERFRPVFSRDAESFLIEHASFFSPGDRVLCDAAPMPPSCMEALINQRVVWTGDAGSFEAAASKHHLGDAWIVRFRDTAEVRPGIELALHRRGSVFKSDGRGEIFLLEPRK